MSEWKCYFQIFILTLAATGPSCTSLAPWRSKSLKREKAERSNLLSEVNGTVMIFCCVKVEICVKSQKPVILESSFKVHLFLLAEGYVGWFKVKVLRDFSLFSFSLAIIKMYWSVLPVLNSDVGQKQNIVYCKWPIPQLWLNPNLSSLIPGALR